MLAVDGLCVDVVLAVSLGGCLILAAIAIENTVAERKAELDVLPDDPDVKKFDDEQTDIQTRTRAAMAWAGYVRRST